MGGVVRPSGQGLSVSDEKGGGLYPGGVGEAPAGAGWSGAVRGFLGHRAKIRDSVGWPARCAARTPLGQALARPRGLPDWLCNCSMTSPSTPKKTPSSARAGAASDVATSYEAALEELEQLVAQLDAGQLPLDQLLTRYQRGAELLAFCRGRLEAVENQIKVLEGGELKPWDAA